ncbi:hypothetical protein [Ornithinibacillus sp. JPR2-1]|uniref:hypothetical protein n=1 Tax=Ornithinibacillus sp. JPR2-1 TaxID=2094019 RepID=UPI0031E3FA36
MLENEIKSLIDDHGKDNVLKAAEQLLIKNLNRKVPAGYDSLVQPEKIEDTVGYIESALQDVADAGKAVEEAYGEKRNLVRQIEQVKTAIELTEAEAFMQLDGNHAVVDGKKVTLSNDKLRDMYRKYVSREGRSTLANFESELKAIEIDIFKAKDRWEEAKLSADLIKSRANVQASLLQFLR